MGYFFFLFLFFCFILACIFMSHLVSNGKFIYLENRMLSMACLGSAIWSLGFGFLIIQTDPMKAYYCRAFGMIGVFIYLIFAQIMLGYIAEIKKLLFYILNGFSLLGIPIYFLTVQPNQTIFYMGKFGMTYHFKSGFVNNAYVIYTLILALSYMLMSIYMIRHKKQKRIQVFGKKILLAEFFILIGMVLDTIFPLIGLAAIPGSTVTQFLGFLVLYYAVKSIDKARVNVENMSQFIYYSLAMPVLVYDADEKLQIMNDAATNFLGINQNDVRNQTGINQLFHLGGKQVFGGADRLSLDARCSKNDIYCNLLISRIVDEYKDVIGYIVVVTDLSERMRVLSDLEIARAEAVKASNVKSVFLANMSHEIRTPMNAIMGFSELALKENLPDYLKEYMDDIHSSSKQLLSIVNDILDLTKIEFGKVELQEQDYNISEVLKEISDEILIKTKEKNLDFFVEIDDELPEMLYGDKEKIWNIMEILLMNSVKYTQEGFVKLGVTVLNKDDEKVKVQFSFIDTGIGILEEDLDNLFESFARAHHKTGVEGTGLGLCVVKKYVELMGGTIHVESKYHKGTIFVIVFEQIIGNQRAKIESSKPIVSEKTENGENMKLHNTKVLIVDDNEVNLKVASKIIYYYGVETETCESGEESIALCQKNKYDIIFMDQMMPIMDGIEAMKKIKELENYDSETCKIVALTANAIEGVREQLMKEGFDEYLSKPINTVQLRRIFVELLPPEKVYYGSEEETINHDTEKKKEQKVEAGESLKDMLPKINLEMGINNCGGHLADLFTILNLVLKESEKDLGELVSFYEKKAYSDFIIKSHALKGLCMSIGAEEVSALFKKLEFAGKENNIAYIEENLNESVVIYKEMTQEIKRALKAKNALEETKNENASTLSEDVVKESLKKILDSLESFDYAKASSQIREISQKKLDNKYAELMGNLQIWMDNFETDLIIGSIHMVIGD